MTKKEMTEMFSVMMLAWPNAEMFKGGIPKLAPTIELWSACLSDVDFWTGQQAVFQLCRTCKFPPTIAEFKEQADNATAKVKSQISMAWDMFRMELDRGNKTPEEAYAAFSPESMVRMAIDRIGGPGKVRVTRIATYGDGHQEEYTALDYDSFAAACNCLIRNENALTGKKQRALPASKEES